jgi:hypothetical protein
MNDLEFNDLKIRFAITAAEGCMEPAAKALGIARNELLEIVTRTPGMLDFVRDVRENNADNCQEFLNEWVEAGATWAIKYTLRTLGANRGYGNPAGGNREPGSENRESKRNSDPVSKDQRVLQSSPINWRLAPNDPLVPVVKALAEAKGHVTRAAAALGKTRSALQKLVDDSPALQMEIYQQRESLVDRAETALRRAVHAKRPWAIMFTLSTRRRDAGYGLPSKRANSAKSQRPNLEASAVPENGAQSSNTANFDSRVMNSMPAQAQNVKNQEPGIEIERNGAKAPEQSQPVLIGAAAGAVNGAPRQGDLADVAAELSGRMAPSVNGAAKCARNAPCPCASGRKFKRCCGA